MVILTILISAARSLALGPLRVFSRSKSSSVLSMSAFKAPDNPLGFSLQQSMLRIKDPALSVPFYEKFGFKLLHRFDFKEWKFSLYFMGILPEFQDWPKVVPSDESAAAIFDMKMGQ